MAAFMNRLGALARVNLGSIPRDKAAYGSYLRLFDVDKEEELEVHLVTHEEADIQKGHYSVQSPVGKAMLGKREGDEVTVETPGGKRTFEVLELKTIHER
jgi:transcription elongation factor GreA